MAKRRKFVPGRAPSSKDKANKAKGGNLHVNLNMSTGAKDSCKNDSPAASKANANAFQVPPSFQAPNTALFGAPTYMPSTNPWQIDNSGKLDTILAKLSNIEKNQNSFLVRLDDIEAKLSHTTKKVNEIDLSQGLINSKYDVISVDNQANKSEITRLQGEVKSLKTARQELTNENKKLKDDITDLKCRSMRDNMLFFGIPESVSPPYTGLGSGHPPPDANQGDTLAMEATNSLDTSGAMGGINAFGQPSSSTKSYAKVTETGENCKELVWEFCEKILKIANPRDNIHIDRAHRIGNRVPNKIRPIVVKFVLTEHKDFVKSALNNVDLKAAPFNGEFRVTDQLPQEVREKRKTLIPKMLEERKKGNKATLVRDKLFVNGKLAE